MAAQPDTGPAGILATFREMPRYTRFVLLGVFINQFGGFLQAFMVLYLLSRGFTAADAGVALGGYAAGAIVGTLTGGWLSDKLGARWTIVMAVGSASLLTLSVTLLSTLPAIVAAVFLAGGMTWVSRPTVTALLLRTVPESRQVMVQAMYRTAVNAGVVAGPFVAAWLSEINWNLVFYFDAAAAMSYCLIALYVLPRDHRAAQPAGTGDSPDEPAAAPARASTYLVMLRDLRYLGYLVVQLANGLVHVQLIVVLPLMLHDAGYPTVAYSVTIAASQALIIALQLPVAKVVQRWPLWVAVFTGWILLVVGRGSFGLLEVLGSLGIVIAAALVGSLGQVIGGPSAFAYPARIAPPGATGKYIGSAYSMFQIGYTLGPPISVALWTQLGGPFWALVAGFGMLMSILLVWSMRPATTPATHPERREAHQVGAKETDTDD